MSASPYRRPLGDLPSLPRRRSPWTRVVLASLVIAMLPFVWSEDTSCDGKPQPFVSGLQILFGKHFDNPGPGALFLGLLVIVVGLGFLVRRTQRPWRRLVGEVVAGLAALGTTFLCALMISFGRADQPLDHPAAWIGSFSALLLAIEAWWRSGAALHLGLEHRRARRAQRARIAAEAESRARIAAVMEGKGEGGDEGGDEEEEEVSVVRRRRL